MGHAIVSGGARASVPVTGIRLGDIAVGQLVKINENGSPVEFYVAKHDYESGLNGVGRTLLVRKDGYEQRQWHTSNVNAYATSALDTWFNGTYKALLPSDFQTSIGTTNFYYTPGNGNTTVSTLSRSVFALSNRELGGSGGNTEGSALPITSTLKMVYVNGTAVGQWTRTPDTRAKTNAYHTNESGWYNNSSGCSGTKGVRPCFTLPAETLFDEATLTFVGKVA